MSKDYSHPEDKLPRELTGIRIVFENPTLYQNKDDMYMDKIDMKKILEKLPQIKEIYFTHKLIKK